MLFETAHRNLFSYTRQLASTLGKKERIFFLVTLPLCLGFLFGEVQFAKWGIPLSSNKSHIGQPLRLYMFEIYLGGVALFALFHALNERRLSIHLLRSGGVLPVLTLVFIAFSLARLVPDFSANPLLGIRNSAFAWYLSLPLLLLIAGLVPAVFELLFLAVAIALSAKAAVYLFFYFFNPDLFHDHMTPQLGFLSVFALPFLFRSRWWTMIAMALIGSSLGIQLTHKVQRTTALGLVVLIFLIIILHRTLWPRLVKLTLGIAIVAAAVFALIVSTPYLNKARQNVFSTTDNPLFKSERSAAGLEVYRWSMWSDAWDKFREHPWAGIGFQQQVVHRVYVGGGTYYPNDGMHEVNSAPISGPHNSYLNSIARLGVLGGILLLIHVMALWQLYRAKMVFTFCVVLGQMIYAGFNVGLEGPGRSFFILIALGGAMLCSLAPIPRTE